MTNRLATRLFCLTLVVAMSAASASAQVRVRTYRYVLAMRSQENKFAGEISPVAKAGGTVYQVQKDARGRVTKVSRLRNGKKLSDTVYIYKLNEKLPSSVEQYREGEKTGVTKIQRDEAGNRIREDHFTADGTLTSYEVYTYSSESVDDQLYTAEGKSKGFSKLYYSANDSLVRQVRHLPVEPPAILDFEYNDATGMTKARSQFNDGKLTSTASYTYSGDGDLIREDVYDPDHTWFLADEFGDNLRVKRIYKVEGGTRELRYTYDAKRWVKETMLYNKDVYICRFIYDRFPDGTAKRTLAMGPDGELWAEYPDASVVDVKQNGEALVGKSILHKQGNWW